MGGGDKDFGGAEVYALRLQSGKKGYMRYRQSFLNVAFSASSGFVMIVGRSDINHVYE